MRKLVRMITAAAVFAALLGAAGAQDRYPSRSIKFVVPFVAGSATDTLARLLGNSVSKSLGKGGIRSKEEDEIAGLDLPEMGVQAYPDFTGSSVKAG